MTNFAQQTQNLQCQLEGLIGEIEILLRSNLPQKGNSEEECQLVYTLNMLGQFESACNGIAEDDLVHDPESDWADTRTRPNSSYVSH